MPLADLQNWPARPAWNTDPFDVAVALLESRAEGHVVDPIHALRVARECNARPDVVLLLVFGSDWAPEIACRDDREMLCALAVVAEAEELHPTTRVVD